MRRREFLGVVGGAAASAWPLGSNAQPVGMPVIGYFSSRSSKSEAPLLPAFRKGLGEAGYLIGQNVAIEFRHSDGQDDRLPELAADLVRRNVSVLVATDRPSSLAAAAATTTIPVVFLTGSDPVGQGLAASFSRPDRNLTGMNVFTVELGPKRFELLREMVPNAGEIAFIVNPRSAAATYQVNEMTAAAKTSGQRIVVLNVGAEPDVGAAFETIAKRNVGAVLYGANLFYQVVLDQLVALAARHAVPAMYEWREFVEAGGLMSYSVSRPEAWHQVGLYTGHVLQGIRPADLPIVQSTRFELVINLRTAKTLGLNVPISLLGRADDVIE
jgi:putative tryptophan/tyrosine transport system substrate-binding protein